MQCKRCARTMNVNQRKVIKAFIDHYFNKGSSYISIGDLLFCLGKTEDKISHDLIDLQRLDYIEFDGDELHILGKALNFLKLVDSIIEEMIRADEDEENGDGALQLFYNIIDEI